MEGETETIDHVFWRLAEILHQIGIFFFERLVLNDVADERELRRVVLDSHQNHLNRIHCDHLDHHRYYVTKVF